MTPWDLAGKCGIAPESHGIQRDRRGGILRATMMNPREPAGSHRNSRGSPPPKENFVSEGARGFPTSPGKRVDIYLSPRYTRRSICRCKDPLPLCVRDQGRLGSPRSPCASVTRNPARQGFQARGNATKHKSQCLRSGAVILGSPRPARGQSSRRIAQRQNTMAVNNHPQTSSHVRLWFSFIFFSSEAFCHSRVIWSLSCDHGLDNGD